MHTRLYWDVAALLIRKFLGQQYLEHLPPRFLDVFSSLQPLGLQFCADLYTQRHRYLNKQTVKCMQEIPVSGADKTVQMRIDNTGKSLCDQVFFAQLFGLITNYYFALYFNHAIGVYLKHTMHKEYYLLGQGTQCRCNI